MALWWIACLLVCVVYVLSAPRVWQCEGVDEIEYLGLAHSMVRGFGYTLYGQPYVVYPPLYPFVLSLVSNHAVGAWRWLYITNALLGFAGLVMGATWIRSRFGRVGAWAGWFALLSYFAWSFSTRYLLAEPLFFALSVVVLILAWQVLCEERTRGWLVALMGLGTLLCAMTRFGAVALIAAICLAAFLKWILARSRTGLFVLVAVTILGGGSTVAWEVRARLVDPNAVESYGRWTQKAMGVSTESTGLIAQSVGEGVTVKKSWPERMVDLGTRYGQYVTSNVRSFPAARPLAVFLWLVCLTGLAAHLKGCVWSPVGWYIAISLLIISLTSWLSSYMRYLYPLTPFLFLFLLEGGRLWWERLFRRPTTWVRLFVVLWGLVGLVWSATHWSSAGSATLESKYVMAFAGLCVLSYAGMIVVGVFSNRLRVVALNEKVVGAGMVTFILVVALQSALILAARSKLTERNQTLTARNLAGAVAAGAWLSQNSGPEVVCVSSLPRLTAFLSDRKYSAPEYRSNGELDLKGVDYVIKIGSLINVPTFRPAEEDRLSEALNDALQKPRLVQVYTSGDAAVYMVAKP